MLSKRSVGRGAVAGALVFGLLAPAAPTGAEGVDEGLIMWSRTHAQIDSEIKGFNPGTGRTGNLTDNAQNDFDPAFSPDGSLIAYESSGADVDIWIAEPRLADTAYNLTQNPDAADRWPTWSPDASRIAYARQTFDGTSAIWVIDADGTDAMQLTDDGHADTLPTWSPDGSRIVFASNRDGNFELYSMAPDGTDEQRITFTPTTQEENPDWSPDGTRIAFDACESATWPCPGTPDIEIFVMDPDGSDREQLTDVDRIDNNPAWSPDGSKIVFRSDRLIYTAIWVMNADGSDPVAITPEEFKGGVDPDWGPRRQSES